MRNVTIKLLRNQYLQRHLNSTHVGVRYPCDECDYKARQKTSLKIHKKSKHEAAKYTCDGSIEFLRVKSF